MESSGTKKAPEHTVPQGLSCCRRGPSASRYRNRLITFADSLINHKKIKFFTMGAFCFFINVSCVYTCISRFTKTLALQYSVFSFVLCPCPGQYLEHNKPQFIQADRLNQSCREAIIPVMRHDRVFTVAA